MTRAWRRCRPGFPCPVCGAVKWCSVTPDGDAVKCMRQAAGGLAVTDRDGTPGYLHKLNGARSGERLPPADPVPEPKVAAEVERLHRSFVRSMTPAARWRAGRDLGVSVEAVACLQTGWRSDRSGGWTWPMCDHTGRVIGIRCRMTDGWRGTYPGTRNGLFLPRAPVGFRVLAVEGPTDTLAALTWNIPGVTVIGRPGCRGGGRFLVRWLEAHGVRALAVLADNDGPGLEGAHALAGQVRRVVATVRDVRVIVPAAGKDARDWLAAGGTASDVVAALRRADRVE